MFRISYWGEGFRLGFPARPLGGPHPQGPHSASSSSAGVTSPLGPRTHKPSPPRGIPGHALGVPRDRPVPGLRWRVGCGGSRVNPAADSGSCNRRAEGTPQSRPHAKRHEASICYSEFLLVQVERKTEPGNTFLVCFFGDSRLGQVQFLSRDLSDFSLPELVLESE